MKSIVSRTVLLTYSVLSIATSLHADPIVIGFDNEPAGLKAGGLVHPAIIIASADTDGLRPILDTSGFVIAPAAGATSPPHVAFGFGAFEDIPFSRDLTVTFWLPPRDQGLVQATTDLLSFAVVGTQAGQTDPWHAVIFGLGDFGGVTSPLEIVSGTTDRVVTFLRPQRDIWGLLFVTTSSFEGIDDLTFNTPAIPEPTTLVLVGSGLVFCARRLRRSRRQARRSISKAALPF